MSGSPNVQVVGLIRFSVLADGFAIDLYDGVDNLRKYLFDGTSLEFRFHVFETLCLPSLLRQTDTDFHLVLLTSTELPQWARDRLDALVAPHPNIHVHAEPFGPLHKLISAGYDAVPMGDHTHRAAFRLDNDDALAMGFVARLRSLSNALIPMNLDHKSTAVAFNKGFYVELHEDGPNEVYDTIEREPLSTGTALIGGHGPWLSPYRRNHRALAEHYNLYTDISFPAFLRTIHAENTDRVLKKGKRREMPQRRVNTLIREHFGIEPHQLQRLQAELAAPPN